MNEFDIFNTNPDEPVKDPARFHEEQQCSIPVAKGLPVVRRLFIDDQPEEEDLAEKGVANAQSRR